MIKLFSIGGYDEVGKNMTAIQIDNDVFLFDCGLFLPPIVAMQEQEVQKEKPSERKLRNIEAIPNDLILENFGLRNKVRAIFVSHAHLDHIGAIPYIAPRYNAEVIGTPYSIEVLNSIMKDNDQTIKNKITSITPNSSYTVRGERHDYKVEFINITHSTLQTAMIALHTPAGVILYANDFKFDNSPILGKKPNYERLKEIAKEGVLALIVDSLYASDERKTPSEKIARGLLEDVMLTTTNEDACIVITTFSSHIARLKSIVDFSKQLGRKTIFIGRSLNKYVSAANRLKLVPFMNDISIVSYRHQIEKILNIVNKNRDKFLIVCTGHQGEPGSVLDRLSRKQLPFQFMSQDHVIFSSKTIPTPVNIAAKKELEHRLKIQGVRIFDMVHVSGHAGREDLRDFINMINPEHLFPAHGDTQKLNALGELATELGYKIGKNVHIMHDGQKIQLR
ncbi:ribonuclease J [Candidatus Pacearchaeota archaeon CG06_land_8_20_14_3_00_35_12]|nr:MAG: ribonuclease J [Candidatus Pacearchaeota archaeon CG06_land_8_20_14_3_00_35_12]